MPLLHPPLSFSLQESSALHYFMVFKGTTEADSLHPSLLSMPSLGKVKQIVGSTLRDLKGEDGSALVTNFESDETAAEFANLHKEDGLMGRADDLSKSMAIEELFKELCFAEDIPDLLAQLGKFANKVGGGINVNNALSHEEEGASHVIVTSYVFSNGQTNLERLERR